MDVVQFPFIMSVDFLDKKDYETQVFYTSSILNDIGYFKLAKDLESLSDFFLDKGENPHHRQIQTCDFD